MDDEEHPGFTLHFEQGDDYLYVFVKGPHDSLDVSRRFWERIYARNQEWGKHKLLIEEDFPNQLAFHDMFELCSLVAAMFSGLARIAHVDRNKTDMDLNRFGENVAVNRGLNARVFETLDEARVWLLGDAPIH